MVELKTHKEKEREKEHDQIAGFYISLARQNPGVKVWRLCCAIAEITSARGLRGGKGYTPEGVRIICKKRNLITSL